MSSIDKLSILGVRSFDNVKSETIAFHKPLTLIVGLNGSGKTTIIECLKYATTGELPPNSKIGGAFVHDPKLCGEKEVLAQVKLSFKAQDGSKMIVTRSLQLTVKKNTRSCKELEGALLQWRPNGDKVTLSSRKMDLDALMPIHLGVSKAVLSSVIFCHQEDSLWPLSQPAELKKRFDEIFEALKYTRAIENIKVMQKKQRQELELFKKDEEAAKVNKDRGKKIEGQATALSTECDELRKQHDDFKDRITQASRNAEAAWEKVGKAELIVGELKGKRIQRDTKDESVKNIRESLNEMSDSDEELQRMLEQYDERVQHLQADETSQRERYQGLGEEMQQARGRVSAKERECGSYEAQAENYERQLVTREKLVKETARSHSIRGFDLDLDDEQVAAFMERVARMAREHNTALENHRRENQEAVQREQASISGISGQKNSVSSKKENARQIIGTNDRKIGTLQGNLNSIEVDEGRRAVMEANLQDTESRLRNDKTDFVKASWDQQVQDLEAELRKHDDRKEKLDAELVEATRRAGDSAQLDYLQKEKKSRERQLETTLGAHSEKVAALIGSDWTPDTVEANFQRTLEQRAAHVTDAERQRDGTSREAEQLEFQLSGYRRDAKAKKDVIRKAQESIKKKIGKDPSEYTEYLRDLEDGREVLKTDTDSAGRLKEYFDLCIQLASEHSGCRTCGRPLKNEKEVSHLVRIMEKEKKKVDDTLGEAPKELQGLLGELDAAKSVSTDFDEWERLKEKELPDIERQEAAVVKKRDSVIEQLEEQDGIVSERQSAKRDVEAISRIVQNIAKLASEISVYGTQAQELSAKQKSAGLSRGLEQIQADTKQVNEQARTAKDSLSKARTERERKRNAINSLEIESRDMKNNLSNADYQLKEKGALEAQVEELKVQNNKERENIRSYDKELHGLQDQLAQAQAKYDDVARHGSDKDRELQGQANKLGNSVNQLKVANQEIEAYVSRGGAQQLKRAKREVDDLKREVTKLEQEQIQITREVKKLEEQLRNHEETKRSIADNQRYRRDLRALEQVRREIEELEQHNAEDEKAYWEREGSKWQLQRNKLSAEQATVVGALKSKDETLVSILADYDTEYKDSAKKYKEAHIRVETTKACVDDLGRYGGALDKAIMKYHSLKMEEINRIVGELWRRTYQGTDVDTILIRSENENVKSNKSYNYRVCMVKQDAEMDMRGRCSAGQKVLASIIIRLALAECFGVNCGLIALDEPTTNLDRDNIKALAESLGEIIKIRRQQKNFQLIVITHDEEFLRYMGCSDFADVYYHVSRTNTQTSQIERQSIAEVC